MKKIIMTSIFFCAISSFIRAQVHFDIEVGISPGANSISNGIIINRDNPHDEFQFSMVQVKPQFYGGVKANLLLRVPFFLEGGISYTKRSAHYLINFRMPQEEFTSQEMVMSESEEMILLPVDIGVALGPIDVTSGLTLIKTISSNNELTHLKGFSSDNQTMRFGWQMGMRYGFKRAMAGIEYKGSLHRVCNGMYVNGKSLEIMNVPGRFVFNLQYRF